MTTLAQYMANRPHYRLTIADLADNSLRDLVTQLSEESAIFSTMPQDEVICKIFGRFLIWGDANDQGLLPHLMFQGYWEIWITAVIARYTRSGSVAVDVGANVGYYTLLMAEAVGAEGRVVAFEPNPKIARMLGKSVSINGFRSRVDIRCEAVTANDGATMTFAIPHHEPKNAGVVFNEGDRNAYCAQFGEALDFVEIQQKTLDSLNLENVSVVKIDAEGAELEVWKGMQKTIDANPDIVIVMEFNCGRHYDATAFYRSIAERFEVRHVDYDGNVKPLTLDMMATERVGQDWMLFLSRNS